MYTTGDIFDALGEEVMIRSRDDMRLQGEGETPGARRRGYLGEAMSSSDYSPYRSPAASSPRRREIASLVELQVTWIGGHTHLLGWLDLMRA